MRRRLDNIPEFDYEGFPLSDMRKALLHMRDLGQALYDMRHYLDRIDDPQVRAQVEAILEERDDFDDDFVEIGFGHVQDEAGFLQHLHVLGPLSADQERRVAEFRTDVETRIAGLRREAIAIQDHWQRVRRAYYAR